MSGYKGGGPHDVEYKKPNFESGKYKNTMQQTTATAIAGPSGPIGGSAVQLNSIKYVFGKTKEEAIAALSTDAPATVLSRQSIAYPYDWWCFDDPAAGGLAIEHLIEDGATLGLVTRLRIAFTLRTDPYGGRTSDSLGLAQGFEARVIRPASAYSYYFVWRPTAADDRFLASKIADYATFSAIWKTGTAIEEVPDEIFDLLPKDAAIEIRAGSRLYLDESGAAPKAYLVVPSAAGAGAGTTHRITDAGVFGYCGFKLSNFVYSAPPAAYTAERDIDYSESLIRGL